MPRTGRHLLAVFGTLLLTLFASAALPAAEAFPKGQLPRTAVPLAYRLDLTIDPTRERFSGHAEIDIQLTEPARSIFLHGRDLKMSSATVVSAGRTTPVTFTQLDDLGVARVDFADTLPAGNATLVFDYDAPFGTGPEGLYRLKVGDHWYAYTQLQSIDARAVFPSFDEPGFKVPFTVALTARPGELALSNMPAVGQPEPVGEKVRHRFATSPPLPTYLIAFVVGPFITVEGVAPPTRIRSTPLPLRIVAMQNQAGKLDYALRETPRIVELLEEYFGQPFPYPKLDQIASPVMPGAMENAGADIYGDNILLLTDEASTQQKQTFGMVVAHELAHQWFGDYVTPAWWDDIWLNESFANWMGYRIGNEWRPELNIGVNAIDEALAAMATDSLGVGRPIREPIIDSGDVDSAFDSITYGKGGQIIAMIARFLGDEKFRDGVRLHMQRHPHGNATTGDFFDALASAAGDDRVLAALRGFVTQQGLPVIDLVREGAGYRATQSRYLALGSQAPQQQWIIPFCARRGATSSCTLLDAPSQSLRIDGTGALIPNAGGTGYYRYQLSEDDWNALLAEAATLPAGEALAAIDSLWAQASAGHLRMGLLLRGATAFAANPDSNVALYAGHKLARWHKRGLFNATAEYRQVMRTLFGPKLAAMGFDPRARAHAKDSPDLQKQRVELAHFMAIEARDAGIRQQLDAAARDYLRGNAQALDESLLELGLTVHAQSGNLARTQALFARLARSTDPLFRRAVNWALADAGRVADARWLTTRLGESQLNSTERVSLLSGLMNEPATRDIAFDWLRANYDTFAKGTGLFGARAIPRLPGGFCSMERAAQIDAELRPRVRGVGRGELPFDRMLEGVRNCATLKQARGGEVAQALKEAAAR